MTSSASKTYVEVDEITCFKYPVSIPVDIIRQHLREAMKNKLHPRQDPATLLQLIVVVGKGYSEVFAKFSSTAYVESDAFTYMGYKPVISSFEDDMLEHLERTFARNLQHETPVDE